MLRVCFTHVELGLSIRYPRGRPSRQLYIQGWATEEQSELKIYVQSHCICMKFMTLDEVTHLVTIARNENGSNKERKIQEKRDEIANGAKEKSEENGNTIAKFKKCFKKK